LSLVTLGLIFFIFTIQKYQGSSESKSHEIHLTKTSSVYIKDSLADVDDDDDISDATENETAPSKLENEGFLDQISNVQQKRQSTSGKSINETSTSNQTNNLLLEGLPTQQELPLKVIEDGYLKESGYVRDVKETEV